MLPSRVDYDDARRACEDHIQAAEDYRRWAPDEGSGSRLTIPALSLLIFLTIMMAVVVF